MPKQTEVTTAVPVPNDMETLRKELMTAFVDLKEGRISIREAKELNKFAANAIDSAKVEIANSLVESGKVQLNI